MSAHVTLTDARLLQALTPDPENVAPAGLLRAALDAAARTPQRRSLVVRLGWDPFDRRGFLGLRAPALAWVVVALLTFALVGVATLVGQRAKDDPGLVGPQPSAIPQPTIVGTYGVLWLLGVSLDEAYLVTGEGYDELWHFTEGRWDGPDQLPGAIRSIAVLRDGRLAAATTAGFVVQRVGGWSATPLTGDAWGLAVAADGSVWTSDHSVPGHDLVRLSEVDGTWHESRIACPVGGSYLAVGSDGRVWSGGFAYNGTSGLARYDGWACTAMTIPGAGDHFEVGPPVVGPAGQVAVAGSGPVGSSDGGTPFAAVYDGTRWSSPGAGDRAWVGVAGFDPAGDLLVSTPAGLTRWHLGDGGWVEAPVATQITVPAGPTSLARDGTLWYVDPTGEIRRVRP